LQHYIGNRATTLLQGEPELHIVYSARVTVASFFLPIFVLLVAFFVVTGASGNAGRVSWWRVCASGTLSGGAICGMHYLGNASVSNYHCDYRTAFVVGSVIISVVASTAALALFFVFRSAWTNSWWKRSGCAVVLAGAVSGMHWCAVMGTSWTLIHLTSNSDFSSRNKTVIVTACLVSATLGNPGHLTPVHPLLTKVSSLSLPAWSWPA
jgi:NO-binding membrane sensor protein with MHYT domain